MQFATQWIPTIAEIRYRGTSLTRERNPLGPYRRPLPRVLWGSAFSYGRGTLVCNAPRAALLVELSFSFFALVWDLPLVAWTPSQ